MKTESPLHSEIHDPDGIPHEVVGFTSLALLALAMVLFVVLTTGVGAGVTAMLLVFAIPALILRLHAMSERARERAPR